jgi:TfoX/Sxy family transcriptional regulator of competence genes
MAYDEVLAGRIRVLVASEAGLSEQRMFGGLAFLVNGNMAVAASGQGGLLLRVDPAESADLVAGSPAYVAEMRGRAMPGWLRVDAADLEDNAALAEWVGRGVSFARSLPPKR